MVCLLIVSKFEITMTDFEKLKNELNKINSYPAEMQKIFAEIKGRAFFPGGRGTFQNDETAANKSIMLLGQDFDTKTKYESAKENGEEDLEKNKTWNNLQKLLFAANIKLDDCFFTNAIMGVRCLTEVATGKSPAFKSKSFVKDCQDFFLYQLELQKPKVIIALGLNVAKFLSDTSTDLIDWRNIPNFESVDNENQQIKLNVKFNNDIVSNVALLMHPSARKYNLVTRKYRDKFGIEAQAQIIQDACKTIN